jgi:dihydropteroate synthase
VTLLALGARQFATPAVMGILNVTPDSFADGGRYRSLRAAYQHAMAMRDAGASIIDVGGESTRPGASPVSTAEELDRVIPVIADIVQLGVPVCVDTSKPEVMREAVRAGAVMINDVRALQRDGALETAAQLGVPVVLMHMQGNPRTMQVRPHYDDVLAEVIDFLRSRIDAAEAAGVADLVVDPGFGFGKTPAHNLMLVNRLGEFRRLGRPILMGLSRKGTLGLVAPDGERIIASVVGATLAVANGASIVRVHDVAATVEGLAMYQAVNEEAVPACVAQRLNP